MDLFLLKKLITIFVMPINLVVLLLLLSIIFHWKSPRLSIRCLLLATVMLVVATLPPVSDKFMAQLESGYPVYAKQAEPVDYIVVLGCRHSNDPALPATTQLGDCSLQRVVEALRILQMHPESKIITSGYGSNDKDSHAEAVKKAFVLLGVSDQKITTVKYPRDTQEEAEKIAPLIRGKNAILVTNADHMQRAMKYFVEQGVHPVAAPAGYWVRNSQGGLNWAYYLPNSRTLYQTTTAWYESLGQLVQWLKTLV